MSQLLEVLFVEASAYTKSNGHIQNIDKSPYHEEQRRYEQPRKIHNDFSSMELIEHPHFVEAFLLLE